MHTELFIHIVEAGTPGIDEWKQIELVEETSIPLNFNIADIRDFTKKNSSYSKTITIPGTQQNNTTFKHLYNIGSYGSFVMGKSFPCYILEDTNLIFEGNFELTACIVSGYDKIINYEANVYTDTVELANIVGDKLLRGNDNVLDDLDFSAYDHVLNYSNVNSSFSTTPGSGYTYITVDKTGHWYKDVDQGSQFKLDELTPCLFIKEIWDKILEGAGFSYSSTFLNSNTFKRLIYPHTDRWLRYDDIIISDNSSSMDEDNSIYSLTITPASATPTVQNFTYVGDTFTQGTNECFNETTGEFIAEVPGIYNIRAYNRLTDAYLSVNIGIPLNAPIHNYYRQFAIGYVRIVKVDLLGNETVIQDELGNNMEHQFFSWQSPSKTNPPGLPEARYTVFSNSKKHLLDSGVVYDYDISGSVYLNIGEKIKTQFIGYITPAGSGASTYDWFLTGDTPVNITLNLESNVLENQLKVELDSRITDNCTVPMTQVLHKVKQIDFLNSIIKMFNLYIEPIGSKKLRIEPRETYYGLSTSSKDWTNKIDVDKDITIEPDLTYRNSEINLRYKDDVDKFNTTYKEATGFRYGEYIKTSSEFKKDNKFEIELIFSPTPGGDLCAGNSMQCPKIFYDKGDGGIDEDKTFNPRILYWKGLTTFKAGSNNLFFVYDNLDNQLPLPIYHYPYAGHFDNVYGADTLDLNFAACQWYWYDLAGTWATWNNLTNLYYGKLFLELNDTETKLVTMSAVLQNKDIQDLVFYNPIFIDGIYYKLNKITDFLPNRLCKIELLKTNVLNLKFTGKHPRPAILKPIAFVKPLLANLTYVDMFEGGAEAILNTNSLLNVDVFDGSDATDNTTLYVDVIDANIVKPPLAIDTITTNRQYISSKINLGRTL